MYRTLPTFALALTFGGLCGCDDRSTGNPVSMPVTTAPAEKPLPVIDAATLKPDEPTPVHPGFATGRVLGADGKPIALPDVRIEIVHVGLLDDGRDSKTTSAVEARPADGVYVARLKPGTYLQPTGRIEFSFNRNRYRLPLSLRPPEAKRQDAADGVMQDFVWKLDGNRPGEKGDKTRPESWIGGSISPEYQSYRRDLNRTLRPPPVGTKVVFALVPTTPLADGSKGAPRTAIRTYNPTFTGLNDPMIVDLPLAFWEVQGEEIYPDGGRQPVLFLQQDGTWKDRVTGTFEADLARSALKPVSITFTRKDQ